MRSTGPRGAPHNTAPMTSASAHPLPGPANAGVPNTAPSSGHDPPWATGRSSVGQEGKGLTAALISRISPATKAGAAAKDSREMPGPPYISTPTLSTSSQGVSSLGRETWSTKNVSKNVLPTGPGCRASPEVAAISASNQQGVPQTSEGNKARARSTLIRAQPGASWTGTRWQRRRPWPAAGRSPPRALTRTPLSTWTTTPEPTGSSDAG